MIPRSVGKWVVKLSFGFVQTLGSQQPQVKFSAKQNHERIDRQVGHHDIMGSTQAILD